MITDSKYCWKIIFIWIPLLPFVLGSMIKVLTKLCCSQFELSDVLSIVLFSLDSTTFSFSIAILSIFVKNDLMNQDILLPNKDKIKEVQESSMTMLFLALVNLCAFAFTLLIHTLHVDCEREDLLKLDISFSIILYFVGGYTIVKALEIQKKHGLQARLIF